jgi:replication factor C small subunit
MLENGLSGLDIIRQVQKEIWSLDIDGKRKLEMIKQCGESEFRLVEGSDEFIQLEAMLAHFTLINQK